MLLKSVVAIALFTFLFIACKHDETTPKPVVQPVTDSVLLVKIEDSIFDNDVLWANDSTVYIYDGNKRLFKSVYSLQNENSYQYFETIHNRDGQGKTTSVSKKQVSTSFGSSAYPDESLQIDITYKSGSDQIDFMHEYYPSKGPQSGDSISYSYTGSSVSAINIYQLSGAAGPALKNGCLYNYNGSGDLISFSQYIQDSLARTDWLLDYDGKTNPLIYGAEDLLDFTFNVSKGNYVKLTNTLAFYNQTHYTVYSYSYREDGRPLRSEKRTATGELVRIIHWFYE